MGADRGKLTDAVVYLESSDVQIALDYNANIPAIAAMQVSHLTNNLKENAYPIAQKRNRRPILRPSPSWDIHRSLESTL